MYRAGRSLAESDAPIALINNGIGITPLFSTLRWHALEVGKRGDSRTFAIRFERSGMEAQWSEGDPTRL